MKRISTDADYLESGKIVLDADGIPFEPASKGYVDQRVPVSSFTGTGSPEGNVAAPVGSIYTDTAATAGAIRWIKAAGTGNTGWETEVVYTGVRNIAALMSEYMSSTWGLDLTRRGSAVQCSLFARQINRKPITSGDVIFTLPAGFRPSITYRVVSVQPSVTIEVSTSGRVTALGAVSQNSYFTFMFTHITSDTAAATLPGAPA